MTMNFYFLLSWDIIIHTSVPEYLYQQVLFTLLGLSSFIRVLILMTSIVIEYLVLIIVAIIMVMTFFVSRTFILFLDILNMTPKII